MTNGTKSAALDGSSRRERFFDNFIYFSWWQRISAKLEAVSNGKKYTVLAVVIVIGIVGRMWAQSKPGNFDFNVWLTASTLTVEGVNPYTLNQFNYGPTWLGLITGMQYMSPNTEAFRLSIAIFLTLVDIGIFLVLVYKRYALAAIVFFLSPITIAISGQHQQIDNIAILITLVAVLWASKSRSIKVMGSDWVAVLLLGLGLSVKHVFLLFPVWLAIRPGPVRKRLFYLLVPYLIFGLSLLGPFLTARETVIGSMVQYSGANNSPVLYFLVPDQLMVWISDTQIPKIFFFIALTGVAYLFRRVNLFEYALVYTISAVVFSWAIVNQYLAVPMAGIAVWMNVGFLVWLVLSSIYLWGDVNSINFPVLNQLQPHMLLEYDVVAKDLFPWILLGWLLIVLNRNNIRGLKRKSLLPDRPISAAPGGRGM